MRIGGQLLLHPSQKPRHQALRRRPNQRLQTAERILLKLLSYRLNVQRRHWETIGLVAHFGSGDL